MEKNGELSVNRNRRSLPGVFPAAGSEGQPVAAQIAVGAEGTENVLRRADEQPAQVGISFFGDVSLWLALTRIVPCGNETGQSPFLHPRVRQILQRNLATASRRLAFSSHPSRMTS